MPERDGETQRGDARGRKRGFGRVAKPDTREDMRILRDSWSAIAHSQSLLDKPIHRTVPVSRPEKAEVSAKPQKSE